MKYHDENIIHLFNVQITFFAIQIHKKKSINSVNTGRTFLDVVHFRNVLQSEGVVAIDPAERRRCAVLWTGNCNIH